MKKARFFSFRLSLGGLLIALTSCFSTHLPPLQAPPAVARLDALADAELAVQVDTSRVAGARGYQYLTAMPITRVYTPDLQKELLDQLRVQAGLKGYRLVPKTEAAAGAYELDVTVEELSVSGYCYLLVRRPHSDIRLTGVLRNERGDVVRECSVPGQATFTAKFAFSDELNEARRIALTEAAVALVGCLELKQPRPRL